MRALLIVIAMVVTAGITACNKSSPPPQKPLTPRSVAEIEIPLHQIAP